MKYIYLGFDWDGTMCEPSKLVPEQLKKQIQGLANQGVKLFFASGKSLNFLSDMSKHLEITPWLIAAENGGHIWCNKMSIQEHIFGEKEQLEQFSREVCNLNIPEGVIEEKYSIWTRYFPIDKIPYIKDELERLIKSNNWNLKVYTHPDGGVDVVPRQISKSNVIGFLPSVKDLEVHYFGDSYNDLSIMGMAEIKPHCVGNAKEEVKELVKVKGGIVAQEAFGQGVSSILTELFGL